MVQAGHPTPFTALLCSACPMPFLWSNASLVPRQRTEGEMNKDTETSEENASQHRQPCTPSGTTSQYGVGGRTCQTWVRSIWCSRLPKASFWPRMTFFSCSNFFFADSVQPTAHYLHASDHARSNSHRARVPSFPPKSPPGDAPHELEDSSHPFHLVGFASSTTLPICSRHRLPLSPASRIYPSPRAIYALPKTLPEPSHRQTLRDSSCPCCEHPAPPLSPPPWRPQRLGGISRSPPHLLRRRRPLKNSNRSRDTAGHLEIAAALLSAAWLIAPFDKRWSPYRPFSRLSWPNPPRLSQATNTPSPTTVQQTHSLFYPRALTVVSSIIGLYILQ